MYICKIIKIGTGYGVNLPASFVRDYKIKPYIPMVLKIGRRGEIIFDVITPEKYPDLFRIDDSGFTIVQHGKSN